MSYSHKMLKLKSCFLPALRSSKHICLFVAIVALLEFLLLHIFLFYVFIKYKDSFSPLIDPKGRNFIEKISSNKFVKDAISTAKYGGLVSLIQETVERIYVTNSRTDGNHSSTSLGKFKIDSSHSGEFLYLYERILSRRHAKVSRLIIDVGANDGFLSSNSFNFIQHGWDALLVEPLYQQIETAKKHLQRYIDPYKDGKQNIKFVQAILGTENKMVDFVISKDSVSMESHVLTLKDKRNTNNNVQKVKCIAVSTFIANYKVPKYFGILSIDAEGQGNKILHAFIDSGSRPAYIIYEHLHEGHSESIKQTTLYLQKVGYKYLTQRGWNHIYEYV